MGTEEVSPFGDRFGFVEKTLRCVLCVFAFHFSDPEQIERKVAKVAKLRFSKSRGAWLVSRESKPGEILCELCELCVAF